MKQIFIILFLLINLNSFSQITFSGVKKSNAVIDNKGKDIIEKKELNTSNITTEEEPQKVSTTIIQNKKTSSYDGKVNVKIYNPKEEAKFTAEKKNNKKKSNKPEKEKVIVSKTNTNLNTSIEIIQPKTKQTISTNIVDSEKNRISSRSSSVSNSVKKVVVSIPEEKTVTKQEVIIDEPLIEPIAKKEIISKQEDLNIEIETPTKELVEEENIQSEEIKTTILDPQEVSTQTIKSNNINKIQTKSVEKKVEVVDPKKSSGIFFDKPLTAKQKTIKRGTKEIVTTKETNPKKNSNSENLNALNSLSEKETKPSNPKKGSWSVGLGTGLPIIIGDMESRFGYGASITVQKAIGHVFSLRFQAIALETFGRDNKLVDNTYSNYKTRFSDYTLQGVFTLNNLNFYKKEPKVIYNLIAGAGLATRHSWMDRFDENASLYSYDAIPKGDKTTKALNDLFDKNYETIVTKDPNFMSIKNTNILPSVVFGAGIAIKLSKTLDLNLESRMSYHFNDNLDAHQRGTDKDWMSFTTLGLTLKIPSKNESMLWTNPAYSNIEEIKYLKKKVAEGNLLKDEDKDGIADIFDQDLNTPEMVAVDSRGVPADMDRDGVPDYKDAEPFTTIGAQVDANGVALDSDNDGIADVLDLEKNTLLGNQVDANGRTINTVKDLEIIKDNSDFEIIFFDINSFKIKKEFYSELYKISKYITGNPTTKIQITGHTDVLASEKYNLDLSEKRANAVYSALIELFKISSNNLITKYVGEHEPLIEGLPKIKDINLAPAYYLNRRVEFKILK